MDLITNRTIEITKLGMDGLMDRQHAVSSNIANVMTPGFQRKEVAFESQLAEIIENEDLKDYIKEQNSVEYKPPMVDVFTGEVHTYRTPTMQEKAYLQSNLYDKFNPQVVTDVFSGTNSSGNICRGFLLRNWKEPIWSGRIAGLCQLLPRLWDPAY